MPDWFLTLVVAVPMYMGMTTAPPGPPLVIRLPERSQCEAVRRFLIDLDALPQVLYVGECVETST